MWNAPPIILIIDDNADHIAILSGLLTHQGYAFMTATSPQDGLRFARRYQLTAILLDLHFDRVPSGISVIDELRAEAATAEIPILVVSSFTDSYYRELQDRRVPFISKGDLRPVLEFIQGLEPAHPPLTF